MEVTEHTDMGNKRSVLSQQPGADSRDALSAGGRGLAGSDGLQQPGADSRDALSADGRGLPDSGRRELLRERQGTVILVIGCALWGVSGTCGQYLFSYKGVESGWLVMVRMLVAGVLLTLLCAVRGDRRVIGLWKNRGDALRLLLFSFCGLLLSQYSYLTAIYYTNAGTATILQEVSPVLIIVLLCIEKRRLPKRRELLCIALALAGTYLIATKGNPGTLALSGRGLFWGLMSAVGIVTYSMTSRRLTTRYGSIPVMSQGMLIAGIAFALFSGQYRTQVSLDGQMIFPLFGVVILGTVCAYTMYMAGVKNCGPFKASVIGTIEPVTATILSCLWLGSAVTLYDILGGILIISLVILQSLPEQGIAGTHKTRGHLAEQ